MAALDGGEIFYTNQNFGGNTVENDQTFNDVQQDQALKIAKRFIREFVSQDVYVYRQQLIKNVANQLNYLEVEIDDIQNFDLNLYNFLIQRPLALQSIFEQAIKECYCEFLGLSTLDQLDFQLQLVSQETPRTFRDLTSKILGKLITVSGIIISLTQNKVKAQKLNIQCSNCEHQDTLILGNGLSGQAVSRKCNNTEQGQGMEKCPLDPYVIFPEKSQMIDQQLLKIQETPESIPTGEVPRNFNLCVDRYLVNQLIPGQRVVITGVYSIQYRGDDPIKGSNTQETQLKTPYLHVLGTQLASKRYADTSGPQSISQSEIQFCNELARSPYLYNTMINSIAPAIFGHDDVKLALACLLFGGSSKTLPDGMKLRGDINVLLVGDPSTAKSQLLKFIERVSDIAVYTSGKGSSAAGLTASITQGAGSNQFTLEAGALVLASGGVCCIDEFDKMRPEDRVVMHEAMEQQTISIAKAGITTRLNAKCSVLAAANPIFGRYEESKSITDQIELQTTILSRFDCIFIIKDKRTVDSDKQMAGHVLNVHTGKFQEMEYLGKMEEETPGNQGGQLDMNRLKSYVKYAKSMPTPRLSARAAQMIENLYVQDRQQSEAQGHHRQHGGKSHIPITVRQLEAIIRLSEALAKMQLMKEVNENHVKEAHRLFQNSTLNAVSMGARFTINMIYREFGLDLPQELKDLSNQIEESIKRRLAIGAKVPYSRLKDELVGRFNNIRAVEFTIEQMVRNEDLQQIDHRKTLYRKK